MSPGASGWRGDFGPLLARPDARVLDLCCGTGDLALALRRRDAAAQHVAPAVVGADFAIPCWCARKKRRTAVARSRAVIAFLEADALSLPFAGETFDLVHDGFRLPQSCQLRRRLPELRRVLRPGADGGHSGICGTERRAVWPAVPFLFSSRAARNWRNRLRQCAGLRLPPRLGGALSRIRKLCRFDGPALDFRGVHFERWTGGIVALHTGQR